MAVTTKGIPKASAPESEPCRLLELPAEVRNEIYELTFTSDSADREIDFLHATPPSKALLLCSHQTYDESNGFYKQAYRAYWSSTKFAIFCGDAQSVVSDIRSRRDEEIAAIRDLIMREPSSTRISCCKLSGPAWEVSFPDNDRIGTLIMMPEGSTSRIPANWHFGNLAHSGRAVLVHYSATVESVRAAAELIKRQELTKSELITMLE
ncbi:hypothetical protein LTR85_005524 [Meristemomyces frigidus]|nr:hypothetical protein LTR85_005524 [Meristemomyces frigidus]